MEFIDLAAQQNRIGEKLNSNIQQVLKHGKYIMGPEVKELESRLASYVGAKHAVACSSGTDSLLLALMAYGVGNGDAIFTTPFTFIATAEVISLLGATPIFVDVDPVTYNIDPKKLEQAIDAFCGKDKNIYPLPNGCSNLNSRGIIAVDLFGLAADYDSINKIAEKHNLFVIEDAAQSFGGEFNGNKTCSLTDIGCTSFFPAKPLGCYGDGGMCFTDNDEKAEIMRSILVHGKGSDKYDNVRIGINGRLDTIQAAILHAKFDIFPEEIDLRNKVAKRYNDLLASQSILQPPCIMDGYISAWAQYSILAKDELHRAELQGKLKDAGIPTAIYYPKPLHLQTAFKSLAYNNGDFPVSEESSNRIFSIPMHPYMTIEDQEKVANVLTV